MKRVLQYFQANSAQRVPRSHQKKARLSLEHLEGRCTPAVVSLSAVADNTLYQSATGTLSNGAGQHFFVGDTQQATNDIRRGLIRFDLSSVPVGSIINSATLTLHMSKTNSGAQTVSLHAASKAWGEGTSNASLGGTGTGEGDGIQASAGDATWLFTLFNTQAWSAPGGDFVAGASASASVSGQGSYQWTGSGLITNVQQWVNSSATNFGWVLTGNESTAPTAKEFDSKENATAANRPVLTVDFTTPLADLILAKTHTGNFKQGDAGDTYQITVANSGSGPTSGTVTVSDTVPSGLIPTAADNGNINGWSVSTNGQTITATRGDSLANSATYPVLTLTVRVAGNAPANVTNTATVSGGGETNLANDSASDPTTITQLADLTIAKSHTGSFKEGDTADTYKIVVSNTGAGATTGAATVTDNLPIGLTPTAADSGTISGWTVSTNGQKITATRSDALASGVSYPVLTITVGVAQTAPASVTNTATVSGGGEGNTANDSASDPTAIGQVADLILTKIHSANFAQGDAADTYTITVHNSGSGPSTGAVTINDVLPTGLSSTAADTGAINGWTVSTSGQKITATRSDALVAGSSFPVLTVTVAVANDAASDVTNMATVSGGGEVNLSNDTASNPTHIYAPGTAPPISSIAPLSAARNTLTIPLTWSAQPASGATIVSYDIFVSDNGGAFTALLTGTTKTSTTFTGQSGHTYGFYSVTTDNLGNREPTPSAAQTMTLIDTVVPTSKVLGLPAFSKPAFTVTWAGSDNTGGSGVASFSVFVSDNGGTFTVFQANTTKTSAVFNGVVGHVYGFYSIATDNAGNREATPSAAEATTNASLDTPNKQYVAQVFLDLLGRPVDVAGLGYWAGQLGSGQPRGAVATLLTHSAEYFATIIKPAYLKFLGRAADNSGLASWIGQMQAGLTDEHLEAQFIASAEYYAHNGGTDKGWIDGTYHDLLGRTPDPSGEAFWIAQASMNGRFAVALGFATSAEREQQHVTSDYVAFLRRTPDQSGLAFWTDQFINHGKTNEDLITGFLSSDEYYAFSTQ